MKNGAKGEAMKRLAYIEGHLDGVRKMVEEDRYCVDILKQTHAIRRAIEKFEVLLLDGHLESCVVHGIREGREKQIVAELRDLYTVRQR
ncbi:MAG: metal-sensitive transcriptional regulator [Chloroflexi bacterium]|nr:metal-sensitive transcriptional regulator [Chloroflexota bacterium]